jgi:hypothetical protein
MPRIRVQRTFTVRLRSPKLDWKQGQVAAARERVIERAIEDLDEGELAIGCSVDGERFVAVVAKEVPVERFEQITPHLVSNAGGELVSGFEALAKSLGVAAWCLGSEDEAPSWESVYRDAGFDAHLAGGSAASVFGIAAPGASKAEVRLDIDGRVAAAVGDPERLRFLARSAVIARAGQYGSRATTDLTCDVELVGQRTLRVSGGVADVDEVVRAVLGPPVRRSSTGRVIDSWPPPSAPYWGAGSLTCAALAVGLSWSLVVPWAIVVLVIGCALAVATSLRMAKSRGAHIPTTLLGLAPAVIVIGFGTVYAVQMRGPHPGVNVRGTPHMVDALLLSFGVATTGGFLDLSPHSLMVRIEALVEMLLMVGIAGGSAFAAGRAVWRQLTRSNDFIDQ